MSSYDVIGPKQTNRSPFHRTFSVYYRVKYPLKNAIF